MLAYLYGVVKSCNANVVTIEVGGIVGFAVQVPRTDTFEIDKKVLLYLYTHWNQEQGPSLYGFCRESDRAIFSLILGCSGVGPKLALAVLADLGASSFIEAAQANDIPKLSQVSGIGTKKAEQIVVQLKHKVNALLESGDLQALGGADDARWQELSQALKALNYSRAEIAGALRHVHEAMSGVSVPFDQMMRSALSFLAKMR